MRIERVDDIVFDGDKRQYLPFIVYDTCPKCGKEVALDLTRDYMPYPEIGKPTQLDMYHCCDSDFGDDVQWSRRVIIGYTLVEVDE